jgi:hypothetical protein
MKARVRSGCRWLSRASPQRLQASSNYEAESGRLERCQSVFSLTPTTMHLLKTAIRRTSSPTRIGARRPRSRTRSAGRSAPYSSSCASTRRWSRCWRETRLADSGAPRSSGAGARSKRRGTGSSAATGLCARASLLTGLSAPPIAADRFTRNEGIPGSSPGVGSPRFVSVGKATTARKGDKTSTLKASLRGPPVARSEGEGRR